MQLTRTQIIQVLLFNHKRPGEWQPAVDDHYTPADNSGDVYRIVGATGAYYKVAKVGAQRDDQRLRQIVEFDGLLLPIGMEVPTTAAPDKTDFEFDTRVDGMGKPSRYGDYIRFHIDGEPHVTSEMQATLFATNVMRATKT